MRCLAKNPDERYPRAADLADALVGFLSSATRAPSCGSPGARAARRPRRVRGDATAAGTAASARPPRAAVSGAGS
jgi:hypothetical protein